LLVLTLVTVLFTQVPQPSVAEEPVETYVKRATWAETMVATRANFRQWLRDYRAQTTDSEKRQTQVEQGELRKTWKQVSADFREPARAMQKDFPDKRYLDWFSAPDTTELDFALVENALTKLGPAGAKLRLEIRELAKQGDARDGATLLDMFEQTVRLRQKQRKSKRPMDQISKMLQAMEEGADELREQLEALAAAEVPDSDRRWRQLQTKVEAVADQYGRAQTSIKEMPAWLAPLGGRGEELLRRREELSRARVSVLDPRWTKLLAEADTLYDRYVAPQQQLDSLDFEAVRRAIRDTIATFPEEYAEGQKYLDELQTLQDGAPDLRARLKTGDDAAFDELNRHLLSIRTALLSNPVLDFERLLLVRRRAVGKMGLPQNWQGNCALPKTGYDNEIAVLSPVRPDGKLTTLYRPDEGSEFVGDVDLHYDADRLLFSMPGSQDRWQIWEIGIDGRGLRQVTPGEFPDVDNYDACYLPDDRIIFDSTRCFHGVPCVGGKNTVANLFRMNADGTGIRQLCFDQDHDWCPTVLNNGRVLYSRWEYTDSPHYFTRLLFHMNPDGTGQMEYYGSNSPWPNSFFYARPIPGHPTRVIAVISGHHGVPRMGELVLFDPALGRQQADGAVQRIPGYGKKVEPVIGDGIVNSSWPRFLHPFPLGDTDTGRGAGKYFLVSCQPNAASNWGIYLVDVFDNMTLIYEEPGYAMLEPVPLRPSRRPPVIPDRVDLTKDTAVVYLSDVYFGDGLKGVPRGTVKSLRIYEQHYAYPKMGGHIHVGIDGPWDVKRMLGTVPVEEDGSANFTVPANTPIAVQPLDDRGRALQIMRSWFTAMPGEILSCVGCHESQNSSPPSVPTLATQRAPSPIKPWYGPPRGFSFAREVQPVLDKYCVGCHDGQHADRPNLAAGAMATSGKRNHRFTPSYVALHPYVRRPGPESDYFMQQPLEFHASTSELVQMLEKGHYNVALDDEAWDRLTTWIDLNVPDHGTWHEHREIAEDYHQRRLEMRALYANRPEDPESITPPASETIAFVEPSPMPKREPPRAKVPGWPFDEKEARRRQETAGWPVSVTVSLGDQVNLDLALIPSGDFLMGSAAGAPDEYPVTPRRIEKPFYLGTVEITNRQFDPFDPSHDSAYISMTNKDHSRRGHPINGPDQPVVRITWRQANEYCRWLSQRTGKCFRLPTEAEWEWACRAGSDQPFYFGTSEADFSPFANLADRSLQALALRDSPKWHPREDRCQDGTTVTANVGRYDPNAWGLRDMHGNVAEWTASAYRPYPYDPGDGRESATAAGAKVARGGSWYDRPHRATASYRSHFQPWQPVYNVGLRVLMEVD
jgi:formylglycine-generating enzyme required for sulfatase activity